VAIIAAALAGSRPRVVASASSDADHADDAGAAA
jgi:hypothetical protein